LAPSGLLFWSERGATQPEQGKVRAGLPVGGEFKSMSCRAAAAAVGPASAQPECRVAGAAAAAGCRGGSEERAEGALAGPGCVHLRRFRFSGAHAQWACAGELEMTRVHALSVACRGSVPGLRVFVCVLGDRTDQRHVYRASAVQSVDSDWSRLTFLPPTHRDAAAKKPTYTARAGAFSCERRETQRQRQLSMSRHSSSNATMVSDGESRSFSLTLKGKQTLAMQQSNQQRPRASDSW
jgi:hypothetical protein